MTDNMQNVTAATAPIAGVGNVAELRKLADEGLAPAERPKANVHVHLPPNFSAFDSVEQVIDLARQQGVGVLGVTNYYDYRVYDDFAAMASKAGIFPLFGLEVISLADELVRGGVLVNDPSNPGRMYICGKGLTRFADPPPRAAELLGTIRRNDEARMVEMAAKVADLFAAAGVDTHLDAAAIAARVVARHGVQASQVTIQERHIAMAFQEVLFEKTPTGTDRREKLSAVYGGEPKAVDDPVAVQGEIRSRLMKSGKPAFVAEKFLTYEQARELVLALGGIPCYPTLADGAKPVCPFEDPPEKLVAEVKRRGMHMAELIPIRNEPDVLTRYVKTMRSAGLPVVAGTEHNTLDLLGIEPTCVRREPIPEELKDIFWEGAAVIAAHQFLTLHGQTGFVDAAGEPNGDYGDAESRIAAFAALGAAVIEKYYRTRT